MLCVVVGCALVAGGFLKAFSVGSEAYSTTLAWQLSGESGPLIVATASLEALLGTMLIFGLGVRTAGACVLVILLAFSIVLIWYPVEDLPGGVVRPCGCFGNVGSTGTRAGWESVAQNGVLGLACTLGILWTRTAPKK